MRLFLLLILFVTSLSAQLNPAVKCGFGQHAQSLNRTTSPQIKERPILDSSHVSPAGFFRIHYTLDGVHAVTGSSAAGTPLFVIEAAITADSAYSVLVDELDFLPPVPDAGVDGPELDIFLVDMKTWENALYYGMTYFENYTPSPTYLLVDNDYTESGYSTSGINALQVTIAHEFFHMVQLRYSHPAFLDWSNVYWYEISSVWFEEFCYPDINDYHAYVQSNFNAYQFPGLENTTYMYGHGIYGQVLDKEYGTRNSKHIMLDLWENLSDNDAMDNLEQVLNASPWNSSLTDALGKYALYNVFTGSRAITGLYYDDAAALPEVRTMDYLLPYSFPDDFSFALEGSRIGYKRFSPQTSTSFFVSSNNLENYQRIYLTKHTYENGSSLIGAIEDYWVPSNEVNQQDYFIFPLINGSRETAAPFSLSFDGSNLDLVDAIQTLYPNPGVLSYESIKLSLMIAASGNTKIRVFDILGHQVHEQDQYLDEGIHIVELSLPESTISGVYFLKFITGRTTLTRKLTVLR